MEARNKRDNHSQPPSTGHRHKNIETTITSEAPLQAYIRHLHETRATRNDNDEPVRSKDPWLGVGS